MWYLEGWKYWHFVLNTHTVIKIVVTLHKMEFSYWNIFFSFRDIDVFQDNCPCVFVLCKLERWWRHELCNQNGKILNKESLEIFNWSSIKFAPEMYIKTEIKWHSFPPLPFPRDDQLHEDFGHAISLGSLCLNCTSKFLPCQSLDWWASTAFGQTWQNLISI